MHKLQTSTIHIYESLAHNNSYTQTIQVHN